MSGISAVLTAGGYDVDDGPLPYQRTPYIGVLSKCVAASNSNTVNKEIFSITPHRAADRMNGGVRIAWPNWYVSANNTGELVLGQTDTTIRASIVYPIGSTPQPLRFGGSETGIIAPGSTLYCDPIGIDIPEGAWYQVKSHAKNASGIVFTGEGAFSATLETATFGVTTTDYTRTTDFPAATQAGIAFRPCAIIGYTDKPTFVIAGDSRPLGLNDVISDLYQGRGIFERALGQFAGTLRLAASGERLQTILSGSGWSANYTERAKLLQWCSHVVTDYGINDLNSGGRTAAEVTADMETFITLVGKPVFPSTLEPISASTDSWATTANQTTNATANPKRLTYNGNVRAGIRGAAGYIEIADLVESDRDSGKWKADGTTANLWTNDGTHESPYACRFIAASSSFRALQALR